MKFYSGQKVVCIDDSVNAYSAKQKVVKGSIYTVEGYLTYYNTEYLALEEITEMRDSIRLSFDDTYFAPVASAESGAFAETLVTELEREINEENLILK